MAVAITRTATGAGTAAQPSVISGVATGVAAADRITVLAWTSELASGSPNSVTIDFGGGAVAMTAGPLGTLSGGAVFARLFWLPTPTGTTATFSVTTGATVATTNHQYSVYRVVGASATCSSCGTASSTDMDVTAPLRSVISIPANGGLIAVASGATASTVAKTWAGATEDQEVSVTAYCHTTAMSTTASTNGTTALTCTGGTNGEDGAMAWIVFRESAPAAGAFVGGTVATLASITNPFPTISSMGVDAGDLIIAAVQEITGVTTTAIGDGLGNSFTALTAGALIKPYYLIAPAAGTITPFATTTGSAHDAAIGVAVFKGPFDSLALDKNPAVLTDAATPYAANATGTLTQANELLVGYFGSSNSDVYNTPLPATTVINVQGAIAGASVALSSIIVAATTTQTFSVAGVTGNLSTGCGSATFRIGSASVALAAGPSATSAAATATVTGLANVSIGAESAAATTAAGTATVPVSINVPITGATATGAVTAPTVSGKANASLSGSAAIGASGDVTVTIGTVDEDAFQHDAFQFDTFQMLDFEADPVGVSATAAAGTPTVSAKGIAFISGAQASGQAGAISVTGKANTSVTGAAASGAVGSIPFGATGFKDLFAFWLGGGAHFSGVINVNVPLTGTSASAVAATPTVTGKANIFGTGIAATAQVGTLSVSGKATATLNGVAATAQVGTLTATVAAIGSFKDLFAFWLGGGALAGAHINISVTLTGVSATAAAGTPTVSGKANVFLSPVIATGLAGTVTASGKSTVTLTGVFATGAVNTVTVAGKANAPITGVTATGLVNTVTVQGKSNVTLTGVVGAALAGTPTVIGKANVSINGVQATGAVNTVVAAANANAPITGVTATGIANFPTVSGFANVSLTGVFATGIPGTVAVQAGGSTSVALVGAEATGQAGTPTVSGKANVTLTGAAATTAAGTATSAVTVSVLLSGAAATGQVGTLTVSGKAIVIPASVTATGQAGTPTVFTVNQVIVNLTGVQANALAGYITVPGHTDRLLYDVRTRQAQLYTAADQRRWLYHFADLVESGAFQDDAFQFDAFQTDDSVYVETPQKPRLYRESTQEPQLYQQRAANPRLGGS